MFNSGSGRSIVIIKKTEAHGVTVYRSTAQWAANLYEKLSFLFLGRIGIRSAWDTNFRQTMLLWKGAENIHSMGFRVVEITHQSSSPVRWLEDPMPDTVFASIEMSAHEASLGASSRRGITNELSGVCRGQHFGKTLSSTLTALGVTLRHKRK
ncbi:hypothetical protein EMCRGX_G017099 [Ephydatia muelleri]